MRLKIVGTRVDATEIVSSYLHLWDQCNLCHTDDMLLALGLLSNKIHHTYGHI